MIRVNVATRNIRGFLKNLFDYKFKNIKFNYKIDNVYEVGNKKRKLLSKIIKFKIFDILGVFQVVNAGDISEDVGFSYNRFLKTNKPYIILLENPAGLVNYCWNRPDYFIARKKLAKLFSDENLKTIVCISKTCCEYLPNLYNLPKTLNITQIYPLVPDDFTYSERDIKNVALNETMECLYVSADYLLKGGRDILETFKKIEKEHLNIHVTMITKTASVPEEDLEIIKNMHSVTLLEFNFSKNELNEYYKKSAVLLHPTRFDSFGLVIVEAMKYGCAIIATDVYAIKETVRNNYNGYLEPPLYKLWSDEGKTIYLKYDHKERYLALIDKMYHMLFDLNNDRKKLETFCIHSLKLAREGEFSEKYITVKWEKVFENAIGDKQ